LSGWTAVALSVVSRPLTAIAGLKDRAVGSDLDVIGAVGIEHDQQLLLAGSGFKDPEVPNRAGA
jgi:hypothetical protein